VEAGVEARLARERERMVDEQLARRGITDARVLDAMRRIPRHRFVEEGLAHGAYEDHPLPIGEGQTISQPYIVALMTSLLELTGQEKVLEVGTGSGYQTAVLGALARRVCSVERLPRLPSARGARSRASASPTSGSASATRARLARRGALRADPRRRRRSAVPPPLVEQLAEGGRMVLPVGNAEDQVLTVVERSGGEIRSRQAGDCKFVKLVGKYAWES